MAVLSVCPLLAAQEQQVLAFLLLSAGRKKKTVLKTKPEENYRIHLWSSASHGEVEVRLVAEDVKHFPSVPLVVKHIQ